MHPRRLAAAALALGSLVPSAAQDARFTGEIEVRVHEVVVRVLDRDGRAVPGLTAADFVLEVDGKPLAPASVEWFGPGRDRESSETGGVDRQSPSPEVASAPGRVLVLFFQLDMHRSRLPGLMRMSRRIGDLVRTLAPGDRAAVAVLGSRLTLRLDLTADHDRLLEAIRPTRLFGPPGDPATPDEPSLMPSWDPEAAHRAHCAESAMKVVADALSPLPGAKSVVLVGWGMGRFGRTGVHLDRDYADARRALIRAHTSVFTLDVTNADFHSLEVGLQLVAGDTGGFYARTHEFPREATLRLEEALSGFYLVAFPCPDSKKQSHSLEVRLKHRAGTVLAPPRYDHAGDG